MRKACTARMPVIVSTKCTITRAEVVRVDRNRVCEFFWNQRIRNQSGTSETASTSPEVGSSTTSATPVNTM